MTPTSSHSVQWQLVRQCEDLLALVTECQDHAKVLYTQGWSEGSWDAVYDEAVSLRHKLNRLHHEIVECWPALYTAAQGGEL